MKAKCIKLEYRPGKRLTCEGVKGRWAGKHEGDVFFRNAGYGVGEAFVPSLFLLHAKNGDKKLILRVDHFFKEKFGKLIESRRELIKMTMPAEILVECLKEKEAITDPYGKVIAKFTHAVEKTDLEEWLLRINNLSEEEVNEAKKSLRLEKQVKKNQKKQREEEAARRYEQWLKKDEQRWREKMEALVVQEGSGYFKAIFTQGRHRTTGEPQYEFQRNGKLYVLHRRNARIEPKGEMYVSVVKELVPGKIFLVTLELY